MTEVRTLCDVFYGTVAHARAEHLTSKKDGTWRAVSSGELRDAVEEVSMGLRALGLARGDRVAVLSENRPEWAFVDLATLAAGASDVPIYPTLPAAQVLYILNDSEARFLVVSTEAQARKVEEIRSQALHLRHIIQMDPNPRPGALGLDEVRRQGRLALAEDSRAVHRLAAGVAPEDLATIIYTSGTTGDPKGVMLTHRNIVSNVLAIRKAFPDFGPEDVVLSFLPLSHIFERTSGYYVMLHAGATIAFAESVDKVPENMVEVRPSLMCSVPRLYEKMYARVLEKVAADPPFRQRIFRWALEVGRQVFRHHVARTAPSLLLRLKFRLADRLVFSKIKARTGGRLRLFVSGGAPLAPEIAEFFGAAGLLVVEGYGLTETSPVVAMNRPDDMRPGSVGKPPEGVEVEIARDGEILTRGPHVMKGYFKRPEATAAVIDADGWLHTGDIGKIEDGFLIITDRKKDIIVTSGGKNIAPQPIENLLKTDGLIAEVVMVGNRRNFPSALIVPNFESLEGWARARDLAHGGREDLISRPEVLRLYEEKIQNLTRDLAQFERIKKVALLPREFTIEAGELTPTLKVKRRVVEEKYKDVIDKMYEASAA